MSEVRDGVRPLYVPVVKIRVAVRHTYRLDLAYDGAPFAGFRQQVGQTTVESKLLEALREFVVDLPRVAVGGRTDRGVHARGQVVSFWAREALPLARVTERIEEVGEGALAVLRAFEVPRSFHASFSATGRRYAYFAEAAEADVPKLDAMLCALQGRRCFHAFARRTPAAQSTVRHLRHAGARRAGEGQVRFELYADRFLRRMVRVVVSTALEQMRNGAGPDALLELSSLGDRAATAPPADPDGLYLMSIEY